MPTTYQWQPYNEVASDFFSIFLSVIIVFIISSSSTIGVAGKLPAEATPLSRSSCLPPSEKQSNGRLSRWQPLVATGRSYYLLLDTIQYCKVMCILEYIDLQSDFHVTVHFLPKKHCFWPKKTLILPKDLQKVHKSRQILIRKKIAYVRA